MSTRRVGSRSHTAIAAAALIAVMSACNQSDSLAPEVIAAGMMELQVHPLRTYWDTTRSLVVIAAPSDTLTPIPMEHRVRVSVATSGGDMEHVLLARSYCTEDRQHCHGLFIGLTADADIPALGRAIDGLGARLGTLPSSGLSAGVFVFDPVDVPRVAAYLFQQRHVRWVEPNADGNCGLSSCTWTPRGLTHLTGGIRLRARVGPPVPHDNHLEVQPGDTVRLSVSQPDGSTLSIEQLALPWGSGGPIVQRAPRR